MILAGSATIVVLAVALVQVLRSLADPANTSAPGFMPLAYAAVGVLVVAVAAGLVASALASLSPWWLAWQGHAQLASVIYTGLRVPQGIVQFWDLSLVMKSIDCASWGFDVFAEHNGCLQDPAIYGPGMLWLKYLPLFSDRYTTGLGVAAILISSVVLAWLARCSRGIGQIALVVAALGGPWLLLLERGNIDAVLLWVAAGVVSVVRRWDRLWIWFAAAAAIWLVGTWKYYPFAMGLMLIPALRRRRGWTVLVAFAAASLAFVLLTWENFRFSAAANSAMTNLGDFVVLGRVPVVARMIGTVVGAGEIQFGDTLIFVLALAAFTWGVAVAWASGRRMTHPGMLAAAGSALFLASVVVGGFGWGYKAAFLLLGVPLLAEGTAVRRPWVARSSLVVLLFTGIASVVVWNTVLATLAGTVAASFMFGAGAFFLLRAVVPSGRTRSGMVAD